VILIIDWQHDQNGDLLAYKVLVNLDASMAWTKGT
jgi:hypothetical protein